MAATKTFKNMSDTECCFKIWGNPNTVPTEYKVAPGETCDVPAGYAGNFMKRRAPGLKLLEDCPVEAPPEPAASAAWK